MLAAMRFTLTRKSKKAAGLLAAGIIAMTSLTGHTAEGWLVDFEKAKKQAESEGKSILMEFTGSDWCPPCKALASNVLTKDVFKEEIPKNFVLLKLDNPRDKSGQTEEEIEQYKRLSQEYKVQGVPTIFLADANGKPYYSTVGYSGEPAEQYVSNLNTKAVSFKKRLTAFSKAEDATGLEKARLLDEGISAMGGDIDPEINKDQIAMIIELDSNNEAGLKEKYESILRSTELRQKLQNILQTSSSPAQALESLTSFIENEKPAGALLQESLFYKGAMLFETENKTEAKTALLAAKEVDPDSQIGQRVDAIIKQFFSEE